MSTRIYLGLTGDSFIQSIRKIALLKHMKENIWKLASFCIKSSWWMKEKVKVDPSLRTEPGVDLMSAYGDV